MKRLFILVLIMLIFTSTVIGETLVETKEIKVKDGDTVWSIAKDISKANPNLKIQKIIIDIKKLNNIENYIIHSGDTLISYKY